ncbi:MAG: hypothetical protein IJV00_09615 [Clostridia bacterium]|nr:hypothetical protein [Clostridia bacterium]
MATFTNQASLAYSGGVVKSNVTYGEIVGTLTMTKTALKETYAPQGTVSYIVNIVNSGAAPTAQLTLTDDLGAFTFGTETVYPLSFDPDSLSFFIEGALQPTPQYTDADSLTVTLGSLPADSVSTLIYQATVTEYADPTGSITNTATLTGSSNEITASATVTAADNPVLAIAKALDPTTVDENGDVTYTFTVTNFSGTEAGTDANVSISDTFDPVLTDLAATLVNEKSLVINTDYTYDPATGEFTTTPGAITVPAATFTQNTDGSWITTPGVSVLTVTGTIS